MHNFVYHDDATTTLLQQLQCNLLFVRGNHEAHCWLNSLEQQAMEQVFAVDVYERVYCLKSGQSWRTL